MALVSVSGIDDEFYPAAWRVGLALGLPAASAGFDVSRMLFSESDITPSVVNSIGCVGINQFCPGSMPTGITSAVYRTLSASQQLLSYVFPFWLARVQAKGGIDRTRDLYWLNFYPATYFRGAGDSAVVNPHVGALDSGLAQGKTYVNAGDIDVFLAKRCRGARWNAIYANLAPYSSPSAVRALGVLVPIAAVVAAGAAWWYVLTDGGKRKLLAR